MKPSTGYLIIRVGIGVMIALHGLHKFSEGEAEMLKLGNDFASLVGISVFPKLLGYTAALVQALGGILMASGFFFKYAIAAVFGTLLVAFMVLVKNEEPFSHYSHSLELCILLLGLFVIGPRLTVKN